MALFKRMKHLVTYYNKPVKQVSTDIHIGARHIKAENLYSSKSSIFLILSPKIPELIYRVKYYYIVCPELVRKIRF